MYKLSKWINGSYVIEKDEPCSQIYKIFDDKAAALEFLQQLKEKKEKRDGKNQITIESDQSDLSD